MHGEKNQELLKVGRCEGSRYVGDTRQSISMASQKLIAAEPWLTLFKQPLSIFFQCIDL